MEKRSNVQDMVKGALIIAVIFFHSTLFRDPEIVIDFNILVAFFPCVLGVFFFYSGYNYKIGKRTLKENIIRRTKQLIIPLMILILVDLLVSLSIQLIIKDYDFTSTGQAFLRFIASEGGAALWNIDVSKAYYEFYLPFSALWYLYVLYIISIIFYLIVDKIIIKLPRFIITISILVISSFIIGQFVGTILPYSIQSYPLILAIMLTGAYFSKNNLLEREINDKRTVIIAITKVVVSEIIILGISLTCYYAFGAKLVGALVVGAFSYIMKGFDAIIVYTMAIAGVIGIHNLMKLLNKIKIISVFFSYIGRRVSYVYITHTIFLVYIHVIIFKRNFYTLGAFQPFAYTFMTLILFILISLLINYLIKKRKNNIKEECVNE
jgi:fucose 4-O-acetylase-like acetyltransferase